MRTRQDRRAAAATELAILLPLLGFLFLVVLDYSRVFRSSQILDSAAHSAALYASGQARMKSSTTTPPAPGTTNPDPEAIDWARQAAVREGATLDPPLKSENVSVTYTSGVATVTVTYDFKTSYLGVPTLLTVSRTVRMPVSP
ncbi:MAG: TadE/TadG family type IV pilus assembly protein [Gemmataceae bacterium]